MTGDFPVIVDPYLWKRLKNDDDYYDDLIKSLMTGEW